MPSKGLVRMGDADLVSEALGRRPAAFEDLVRKYSRWVASIALARLGRPNDVDDILQEVFTRAWGNLARLREPAKFSSWLYGITKWVCSERIQDRTRTFVSIDGEGSVGEPFALQRLGDERWEDVLRAVEALPDIYRETLMLFYFEEQSYDELAARFGISAAAVNFRLTRARTMLRERLAGKPK